jgi:hypothetical protein
MLFRSPLTTSPEQSKQFKIMAWRSHRDRETCGPHSDLEWLFYRQAVILPVRDAAPDLRDRKADGGRCHNPLPKPSIKSRATAAA